MFFATHRSMGSACFSAVLALFAVKEFGLVQNNVARLRLRWIALRRG
jgi:hypothetical protein